MRLRAMAVDMQRSFEHCSELMSRQFDNNDLRNLCSSATELLGDLGEVGVETQELNDNSRQLVTALKYLKRMSSHACEEYLDRQTKMDIRNAYLLFEGASSRIGAELEEFIMH
jgi:hypothetical protein